MHILPQRTHFKFFIEALMINWIQRNYRSGTIIAYTARVTYMFEVFNEHLNE